MVVWYLPTLTDVNADLRRLLAIAGLGVEGVSVDIESREVADPADRSRRLVDLSNRLRAALPGRTLGAIVFPPTGMEVINPSYWPGFPWDGIAHDYDVWLPMSYWTFRTATSGYHDGYTYDDESIRRLRNDLGDQQALVHAIGGVGDKVTAGEIEQFLESLASDQAVGGSIYDWASMTPAHRSALAAGFATGKAANLPRPP